MISAARGDIVDEVIYGARDGENMGCNCLNGGLPRASGKIMRSNGALISRPSRSDSTGCSSAARQDGTAVA